MSISSALWLKDHSFIAVFLDGAVSEDSSCSDDSLRRLHAVPSQRQARPIPNLGSQSFMETSSQQEIGTQMVPPCEVVSGCGLTRGHLVARPALSQSSRTGQHGADSEEEACGILPVHDSYCLSDGHPAGTGNLGCVEQIHC